VQPKYGGILHLRLNIDEKPIAHKYRKGKMQRTLKREFKELEVVEREAIAATCRTTCLRDRSILAAPRESWGPLSHFYKNKRENPAVSHFDACQLAVGARVG